MPNILFRDNKKITCKMMNWLSAEVPMMIKKLLMSEDSSPV